MKTLIPFGLIVGCGVFAVSGQSFTLTRAACVGGGGTSAGGSFSMAGVIGQPAAGPMSGRFEGVIGAVPTAGAPRLNIALDQRTVTVSWTARARAFVLEQAPDPAAMPSLWTPVTLPYVTNAATINVVEPVPLGNRFYRLRAE